MAWVPEGSLRAATIAVESVEHSRMEKLFNLKLPLTWRWRSGEILAGWLSSTKSGRDSATRSSVRPTDRNIALSRPWYQLACIAVMAVLAAGCDRSPPAEIAAIDVGSEPYPTDFTLTDHTGKERKLSDFRGKIVALFFGFTQCPDVCPTTLSAFSEVLRLLGPDAEHLQVLFMTIDPERDTQQLLSAYVPAFDSRFLGLYGDLETTRRIASSYHVTYEKIPGTSAGSYTMDHTAYVFIFDGNGRLRLKVPNGQSAQNLAVLIREIQNGP